MFLLDILIYYDILWYTMIYFFVEAPYPTSIAWILTLIVYLLHFPSLIVYISGVLPLSHFYRYVCLHLHDWYVYVMCSVYIYTPKKMINTSKNSQGKTAWWSRYFSRGTDLGHTWNGKSPPAGVKFFKLCRNAWHWTCWPTGAHMWAIFNHAEKSVR